MATAKKRDRRSSAKPNGRGGPAVSELTEAQIRASIPAARARARRARLMEPRAVAAHLDSRSGRIVVELSNGMAISAHPRAMDAALARATPAQLARVEVFPSGAALRWDALDVDLSVTALLEQLVGDHARAIGARQAGRTKSPKKAQSARENGKLGGRPRGASAAR